MSFCSLRQPSNSPKLPFNTGPPPHGPKISPPCRYSLQLWTSLLAFLLNLPSRSADLKKRIAWSGSFCKQAEPQQDVTTPYFHQISWNRDLFFTEVHLTSRRWEKKYRKTSCHTTPRPSHPNKTPWSWRTPPRQPGQRSDLSCGTVTVSFLESTPCQKEHDITIVTTITFQIFPISMLALSFWRSSTERWSLRATRLHSELTSFSAVHTDLNSQAFMPFLSKLLQKKVNCDKNPK